MPLKAKICGLSTPQTVDAAVQAGAGFAGFVFHDLSPRAVSPLQAAELVRRVPAHVSAVGVFVDPGPEFLERILSDVPLDFIQLHGDETPKRVQEIAAMTGLPVIKAFAVSTLADVPATRAYEEVADFFLFDARPPANVAPLVRGGTGLAFDWNILSATEISRPWFLAGGLTAANLAEAVATTHAAYVDVSSGVEIRPGHKDIEKIREFLSVARGL